MKLMTFLICLTAFLFANDTWAAPCAEQIKLQDLLGLEGRIEVLQVLILVFGFMLGLVVVVTFALVCDLIKNVTNRSAEDNQRAAELLGKIAEEPNQEKRLFLIKLTKERLKLEEKKET